MEKSPIEDRYNHAKVLQIVAQLQALEQEQKAQLYVLPNSEPAMFRAVEHAIHQKDHETIIQNSLKITQHYINWWK
jgi:hypothetical protein